mgnify:CR=1 FL=1
MMSCYEQMRANEEIQSRPESGRDTPFDLNFIKVDINVNWVLKVRCPNVSKEKLDLAFNNVKPKDRYFVID